ncbi:coronin-1A-like [Anneissia japonica]|uniref:coronin-1A-like n=1 Tax=Anneissia japonica TaxID=1529436 RepID=UPI0014255212|nr:coronin-1A-like [Anneissia japonica]
MAFVRSSKFRHIFGKKYANENTFTNVRLTEINFDGVVITANAKFLAFVVKTGGGGAFGVLPIEKYGRLDQSFPKVEGHEKDVLVLAWNPFNDNCIASGDDKGVIKIWEIPDGGIKESITEPLLELSDHQRRVQLLTWHCSAENILFSASADCDIIVWNLESAEAIASCSFPGFLYSMSLNEDGSNIVVSCKDKKFRVLDTRTLEKKSEWDGHQGSKPQFIEYANYNMFLSTGFSRMSERELAAWSQTDQKKLTLTSLDTSNSPLHIYYDSDLNVVFLTGKGDAAVRYYELVEDAPYLHFLSNYVESTAHNRIGTVCKRAVNPHLKEICRFYRYESKNIISVSSMIVPRKSDTFQEDIFPDTNSDVPALSASEWVSGKNAKPNKMSFQASFNGQSVKSNSTTKKAGIGLKKVIKPAGGEGGEDEFTALKKEVQKLKSTVETLEARVKTLEQK